MIYEEKDMISLSFPKSDSPSSVNECQYVIKTIDFWWN